MPLVCTALAKISVFPGRVQLFLKTASRMLLDFAFIGGVSFRLYQQPIGCATNLKINTTLRQQHYFSIIFAHRQFTTTNKAENDSQTVNLQPTLISRHLFFLHKCIYATYRYQCYRSNTKRKIKSKMPIGNGMSMSLG